MTGGRLCDPLRAEYLRDHLKAVRAAIGEGVNVEGYMVWSLLDNLEWSLGYSKRFGIVHVDFATQARTPKDSARFYSQVIAANGANLSADDGRPARRAMRSAEVVRRGIGAAAALTLSWAVANAEGAPGGDLPPAQPAAVASVAAHNAHIQAMAKVAPRGAFPRAFIGERIYWTVVGVDGGAESGLLSEDGAIELGKGGASVEPVVIEDGRSITWADVERRQSLKDGYLPIPGVTWRRPGWTLRITAFAAGEASPAAVGPLLGAQPDAAAADAGAGPSGAAPAGERTRAVSQHPRRLQPDRRPGLGWGLGSDQRAAADHRPRGAGSFVDPGLRRRRDGCRAAGDGPGSPARDVDGLATGALVYTLRLPPRGGAAWAGSRRSPAAPLRPDLRQTV